MQPLNKFNLNKFSVDNTSMLQKWSYQNNYENSTLLQINITHIKSNNEAKVQKTKGIKVENKQCRINQFAIIKKITYNKHA